MMTELLVSVASALAVAWPAQVPAAGPSFGGNVHWLENRGQWPDDLRYGSWVGPVWVAARNDGVDLYVSEVWGGRTRVVGLRFEGQAADVRGLDPQPGVHHDYHGDESRWIRGVRSFGRVELSGSSEGGTIVLRESLGRLEIEVHGSGPPGQDRLRVRVQGAERVSLVPDGSLVLGTAAGRIHLAPTTFVHDGMVHTSVPELGEADRITWRSGSAIEPEHLAKGASAAQPELLWSTLWGGVPTIFSNPSDAAEDVFIDAMGNVTVVGTVAGVDYLLTPGAYHTEERNDDLFVAKFRQGTGDLVYSARVGSTSQDEGQAVAVDATGRATVVGWVGQNAQGFPTTAGAFDPVKSQFDHAAVVFRLSPLGDRLEYSTYLEGTKRTQGYGVALAESGSAVVVGFAKDGFPTTSGAYCPTFQGVTDVFVTRLDPTGSTLEFCISCTFSGSRKGRRELDATAA